MATTTMKRSSSLPSPPGLLAVALLLLAPGLVTATTPDDVLEFVSRIYFEGVPYEQASALDADVAIPTLERVLADPNQEKRWLNAAVTLGMIGDDRSADALIAFVTRREGAPTLSRAQTRAKTAAVMSLGYVVAKTGNRTARTFLEEGVDPATWRRRAVPWKGAFHPDERERDAHLATMSILGLGLSGHPESAAVLRTIAQAPTTERTRAIRRELPESAQHASQALETHAEVATHGVQGYYARAKARREGEGRH